MRRILAGTLLLTLLAVAFAAPPVDYEVICGDGDDAILIGVLSLTEGKVHVALVAGAECPYAVAVRGPDNAPEITVDVKWETEPPSATATVDEAETEVVDLVVVRPEAIDGMLTAQRLRAAAMEMRRKAAERGEADRERSAWDDAEGDDPPAGPPSDVPPGDGRGGPPSDVPRGEGPGGRP